MVLIGENLRSEEDLNGFIFDGNFLEDSWDLHSSLATSIVDYPENMDKYIFFIRLFTNYNHYAWKISI
ncbi:hypothetical protein ACH3XW_36650 [Acanthocheilonema viteae]